jgi:hypothetical protein
MVKEGKDENAYDEREYEPLNLGVLQSIDHPDPRDGDFLERPIHEMTKKRDGFHDCLVPPEGRVTRDGVVGAYATRVIRELKGCAKACEEILNAVSNAAEASVCIAFRV